MSKSSRISLKQLRYFVAAARSESFSKAAVEMYVSQSAVTTAISSLESCIGVQLFDRHSKGVTLTADGHHFYQRTTNILDSLEDSLEEPRFRVQNLTGEVRIAASYTLLGYFLPPFMARFRASHPNVPIDLHDLGRTEIEDAVLNEKIDLGIIISSNSSLDSSLTKQVLIRSRRQLWSSVDHPLLRQSNPGLKEVAEYPYIQITVDEGLQSTDRYWGDAGLTRNIALKTGSMESVRELIAYGFGVTILSDMVYHPWSLEGRRIETMPLIDPIPPMEVSLIWKTKKQLNNASNRFKEFLIQSSGAGDVLSEARPRMNVKHQ